MSVELKDLYEAVRPEYEVTLHTKSCFNKTIDWFHMVEDMDFVPLLHGDELVFNSGLNYTSDKWLMKFIDFLNEVHAGGLILSLRSGDTYPEEVVNYCNEIHFPLFSASWTTPYIDIMRKFSEILLQKEQRDTNLVSALKNAIYYPQNEEMYLNHFESNGFFRDMEYRIVIVSCYAYNTDGGNEKLKQIEKSFHQLLKNGIVYEEKGRLIILAAGDRKNKLVNGMRKLCGQDSNVFVGIGPVVRKMKHIHNSYEKAYTAYQLTKTAIPKNILNYDELGVYKLLADAKESAIYQTFVQETLGALLDYDRENKTDYMKLLEAYFENECSILHASEALYCHKNTLAYKMNKIKDILGYDIHSNENRTKIMLSFYILKLGTE